jgi:hypothetical protein
MNKTREQKVRQNALDQTDAIKEALSGKSKQAHRSNNERKEAAKQKKRAVMKLDLPKDLQDDIRHRGDSEELHMPYSGVVELAARIGLLIIDLELVDIQEILTSTRSMRYAHQLDDGKMDEVLSDLKSRLNVMRGKK